MFAAMCHVCLREKDEKEGTGSLIIANICIQREGWKRRDMDSERDENRGLKDLALRFFIYQYGFVYHLNITKQYNKMCW